MASSSSMMTSPMTNTISYIGVSTMDDDVTYRVTAAAAAAAAPKHETCNGLVRNASFSTITVSSACSLPHSLSAQNVKRSVSTVFSSNHRRSWQLSLSNYSQDTTRKDLTTSAQTPEAHELLAVRQAPEGSSGLCCGSSGGLDKRQSQSVIVVYPEDHVVQSFVHEVPPKPVPSVRVIADEDQDLGSGCLGVDCGSDGESSSYGAGNVEGKSGSGYEACCSVGESVPRCGSVTSGEGCPGNVLAWSSHQEPHHIRHQSHPSHHHHHRSHSSPSGCIGGRGDSIEMSLYQINYPATHPTNIHTDNRQGTDATIHQHGSQSHAALQSHSQSVSVLRTTDHSEAVSPSTHGNRKDSERTVRYSSDSDHIDERPKCRLQHWDYDSEKRIDDTTTSSSDCPPDTQPLLPLPRVRVEGVSSSDSPEMCAENTLLRFHSLDSKDSGSKETERTPTMQRAVSINSPHNIAALTSDSSRLLVGAAGGPPVRGGSPTGSDSLAAPALNELYRYHVFLSHCAQDVAWAEEVVARLQAPPYCYQCAYTPLLAEHDPNTLEQKLLCSAMLSERVVLVLSKQYVQETWFVFEKVLRQLTQMSLHNQRIMGVLLEDCEIPDTLGELYFLDTSDPDFFEVFTKRLKTDKGDSYHVSPGQRLVV